MIAASPDAGATMLELLIALGIFAGLLAVATSVMGPVAPAADDSDAVATFIASARSHAILTGEAGILATSPVGISYGDRELAISGARSTNEAAHLLIYPDGTFSGDATAFGRSAGVAKIGGIFRGEVDE